MLDHVNERVNVPFSVLLTGKRYITARENRSMSALVLRPQFVHREAPIGRAEFASQQQKHPQLQRQRESED